jgi:hypothetical protein
VKRKRISVTAYENGQLNRENNRRGVAGNGEENNKIEIQAGGMAAKSAAKPSA